MQKERPPLEEMTLRQLRKVASEYSISRYSRMRKAQLLTAVQIAIKERLASGVAAIDGEPAKAAKFELSQEETAHVPLASVDAKLGELPAGYGESRIVLMPREPQWAYAYWDIANEHKDKLGRQGGQQLVLRLYDITDINEELQQIYHVQEYLCDELARDWYLPIPVSDRDYIVEIGYGCADGRWLLLARSAPVRVPPVYPSEWVEETFITVNWEEDLQGKTIHELVPPEQTNKGLGSSIYDEIFKRAQNNQALRVAGSLFGSMQQIPVDPSALGSHVVPVSAGMWAVSTDVDMPTVDPRDSSLPFWLVADADLIIYGATDPNATVTVGGNAIKLNSDGTFRFQMSLQDGELDYPITAVAANGEETRSIHMKFHRSTVVTTNNEQ